MTRARKLWIASGAAVLLATAAYLLVALTHRLEHGYAWAVGDNALLGESSRDVAVHQLHAGYETKIAITVRNPGSLAVTLDEVSFDSTDITIGEVTMIEHAGQDHRCCLAADTVPFHRVELAAGDQVMVWLALRITAANPYPPCTGFTLERANLRYQTLGIKQSQQLTLRTKIAFRTPCQ